MNIPEMPWRRAVLALAVCVVLAIVVALIPMYPCGYWEAGRLYEEGAFAGHGHHSLATVLSHSFFWKSSTVPVPYEKFSGESPFFVVGQWYISLLYIPIYLAIVYLGYVLVVNPQSRKQLIV